MWCVELLAGVECLYIAMCLYDGLLEVFGHQTLGFFHLSFCDCQICEFCMIKLLLVLDDRLVTMQAHILQHGRHRGCQM